MVVVLPLPFTPMISSTNGLRRPEVDGRRRQRQHLGGAPAQERPHRVGIGQLAAGERAADLLQQLLAGAHADVGGQQHLLDLVDDGRIDLLLAGEDLAQAGDEAGARAGQAGREGRALARALGGRERDHLGGGARGLGGRRRRFAASRARAAGARAGRLGLGCGLRGLAFGSSSASGSSSGSSAASSFRAFGLAEARGRGLADGVDHPLAGGAGAANQQEADQAAGDDAAHDPEQLVELGGVYRRARRVHGGWDIIIKRRCSSMSYRQAPGGRAQSSCNLHAVDECATVYSVLGRVIQESAAVTIHFTYCHSMRTLRRRGI